jgi:hypothetical protein
MKKYLQVLLQDIEAAKANRPPIRHRADDEFLPFELFDHTETSMEEPVETNLLPKRSGNLRQIMGFEPEQFPPADYWSEEEAAQIVVALNDLLAFYNLEATYPKNLPPQMAYTTLVGALEKHAPIMPFGMWYMEFCNYEPSECPFGEPYCSCKDIGKTNYTEGGQNAVEDADESGEFDFLFDTDNPNNISGVHNYCDAWCERCSFNQRCAISRFKLPVDFSESDQERLGFWNDHSDDLKKARIWLQERLAHHKKSLVKPLAEERMIFDEEENAVVRDMGSVAVIQLSERYEQQVNDFLNQDRIRLLMDYDNPTETDKSLREIDWYVYFINVKFIRAVDGKIRDDDDFDDEDFPKDSDGSAKIALIGAERSLVAWHNFLEKYPDNTIFGVRMMALLQATIEAGDNEFPEARAFKRPGFDDNL